MRVSLEQYFESFVDFQKTLDALKLTTKNMTFSINEKKYPQSNFMKS